jgi:hypothetical protein
MTTDGCAVGDAAVEGLLTTDPAHRDLKLWLTEVPQPRPRETWPDDPAFRRIQATYERHQISHPEFLGVHYLAADQVEECWQLLRHSMRSVSYECLAHLRGYSAWLAGQDWTAAYHRHRGNLQLIGLPDRGCRWVLERVHGRAGPARPGTVLRRRLLRVHRGPGPHRGSRLRPLRAGPEPAGPGGHGGAARAPCAGRCGAGAPLCAIGLRAHRRSGR